ncbi:MAG: type II secretion system protein M [Candidatus Omnitrophica bacterium]|nr:type II secretion system protein M [Candidatus Omnitrophota bacterium]
MKLTASSIVPKLKKLTDRFNALSRRERTVLSAALVLVLLVVSDYGVIRPLARSISELRETILLRERAALHNMSSLAQKPLLDAIRSLMLQRLDLTDTDPESIPSSMLHDLELKARSHGLELKEVKPQAPDIGEGGAGEYRVRMQVESTMRQWVLFMADLVRTKKLYTIEEYRMLPHPTDVNKIKSYVTVKRVVFAE